MAQAVPSPAARDAVPAVAWPAARIRVRALTGVAALLAAVAVLVALLVPRLFDRAPALESMLDDVRPAMTDAGIAQLRADLGTLDAANREIGEKVVPAAAAALGTSPAQATQVIGSQFPAVATGTAELPAIVGEFNGLADLLEAEQARFRATDDIPTSSLPATTVPWAILAVGLAMIGVGAWLLATRGRAAATAAVATGLVVVVALAGLSLHDKASRADALNRHVAGVFTQARVEGAKRSLATVEAMATELQGKALPALGGLLGVPADQLGTVLDRQFPAIATALRDLPAMSERFRGLVAMLERNVPRYEKIRPVPFARVIWIVTLAAAAVLVAGAVSLLAHPRRPAAS